MTNPLSAVLRLVAYRMHASDASVYAAPGAAPLRLVATSASDGPVGLEGLAEMLGERPEMFDVSHLGTGVRWALGVRLPAEAGRSALIVTDPSRPSDEALAEALADVVVVAADLADRHALLGDRTRAAAGRGHPLALIHHAAYAIRSPLTTVLGFAECLGAGPSAPEPAEVRDVLLRSGDRLLSALEDLLDLTVPGDRAIVPRPTDLRAVLAEAVAEARFGTTGRIAYEPGGGLSAGPVLLDAATLRRAVRHLLAAAVAGHTDARMAADLNGSDLVVEVERLGAGGPGDDLGAVLVGRLAAALGGTTASRETGGGRRQTLRVPCPPVPIVALPEPARPELADGEGPVVVPAGGGA